MQLTDSYNRKMDYLRISVTDRCNFRCQYCMPEDIQFQDKSHILTLEEMLTFAEACLELGVTKVRVTGGEPLVRRGVVMFIGWLKDLGFEDVTMTTNGFLLKENLDGLVEAGLDKPLQILLEEEAVGRHGYVLEAEVLEPPDEHHDPAPDERLAARHAHLGDAEL